MRFADPIAAWLLIVVALALLGIWLGTRGRRRALRRLGDAAVLQPLVRVPGQVLLLLAQVLLAALVRSGAPPPERPVAVPARPHLHPGGLHRRTGLFQG